MICAPHQILFGWWIGEKWDGSKTHCTYGEEEKCIHCFGRKPARKMPLEDLWMGGRLILKFVVKKQDERE